MPDEKYTISYAGECDRLERQSLMFGHDRGFDMVRPEPAHACSMQDVARGGSRG